jgi:hypothetical protein
MFINSMTNKIKTIRIRGAKADSHFPANKRLSFLYHQLRLNAY